MKGKRFIQAMLAALLALAMGGALALAGCGGGGGGDNGDGNEAFGTVTITVDITAAVEAEDATALALAERYGGNTYDFTVDINEGDTVLDATKATGMVVALSGDFVDSIDGLAAGAITDISGWTFTINGEWALVGPAEIEAADGDVIAWTYITEFDDDFEEM